MSLCEVKLGFRQQTSEGDAPCLYSTPSKTLCRRCKRSLGLDGRSSGKQRCRGLRAGSVVVIRGSREELTAVMNRLLQLDGQLCPYVDGESFISDEDALVVFSLDGPRRTS